jgi:predicted transcriptional regulator
MGQHKNNSNMEKKILWHFMNHRIVRKISMVEKLSESTLYTYVRVLLKSEFIKKSQEEKYITHYEVTPQGHLFYMGFEEFILKKIRIPKHKYVHKCRYCKKYFRGEKNGKYCSQKCRGKAMSGPNHPNWKGGKTFKPYCPKFNNDLKFRVRAFFNFKCGICGKPESENISKSGLKYPLSVHHINYDKEACCGEKTTPQDKRFIALCMNCHSKTSRSIVKENWKNYLNDIIEEKFGGKCYYEKYEKIPATQ